ncbi:retrotransposon protein, putative, ty1-copia subclass [Tanacetum coccineum]
MVRSMMIQTTLPKSFWDYALEFAARILNMVPTKKVDKTPYEETMGYSFYYPPENKVFVARNAEFLENSLITQEACPQGHAVPQIDCVYTSMLRNMSLGISFETVNIMIRIVGSESDKWLNAMNVEMQSIRMTMKSGVSSRLVAKGFTQTPGIDYEETFSLVVDIRAIRILIAITAFYDYEICQMDVNCLPNWIFSPMKRYSSRRSKRSNLVYVRKCLNEKFLKRLYMENSNLDDPNARKADET